MASFSGHHFGSLLSVVGLEPGRVLGYFQILHASCLALDMYAMHGYSERDLDTSARKCWRCDLTEYDAELVLNSSGFLLCVGCINEMAHNDRKWARYTVVEAKLWSRTLRLICGTATSLGVGLFLALTRSW